jgi:hypothetical protein
MTSGGERSDIGLVERALKVIAELRELAARRLVEGDIAAAAQLHRMATRLELQVKRRRDVE